MPMDDIVPQDIFAKMQASVQNRCLTDSYDCIRRDRAVNNKVETILKGIMYASKDDVNRMNTVRVAIPEDMRDKYLNTKNNGVIVKLWHDLQNDTIEANYEKGCWSQKLSTVRALIQWRSWTNIFESREELDEIVRLLEDASPLPRKDL